MSPLAPGGDACASAASAAIAASGLEVSRKLIGEPMGQRPAGRQAGHAGVLAGEQPRRMPKPRIPDALGTDPDREDGRAVHQHHVARRQDADADRLGRRVDRPHDHRRSNRKAGFFGGVARDVAGDLGRPGDLRQALEVRDVLRERVAPSFLLDVIERRDDWKRCNGR